MAEIVSCGTIPVSQLSQSQYVALIHGGAGPQDPKGEKFILGQKELRNILQNTTPADNEKPFSAPWLESRRAEMALAERVGLCYARQLEENPTFNAGRGASLQGDGYARLSASFMESQRQKFSAVVNVENVLCPSEMACYLQNETFSILDPAGAERLSRRLGIPMVDLVTAERFESWIQHRKRSTSDHADTGRTGTIGCVSIDGNRKLAAVTSTGGVGNETPGRIGDTPTIAGNYCDSRTAISCTGIGEQIIAHAVGPKVAVRVSDGLTLARALEKTLLEAQEKKYRFAAIAVSLSRDGSEIEWAAGAVGSLLLWGRRCGEAVSVCE